MRDKERPALAGRNPTIEDVAKAAGVSRQTVSRVINQKTNVSPSAKARVEAAIKDLGYVPNIAARRMGGARSYILLALIERGAARAVGGHLPLGELLLAGIEACSMHGYHLLFEQIEASGTPPAGMYERLAPILGSVQPDGVIIMPPLDRCEALRSTLSGKGIAYACLGERVEFGRTVPGLDEATFGKAAAQRLVDLGHRQVGFVAGVTEPERSLARLEGYRSTLAKCGSRAHRHFVAAGPNDFGQSLAIARNWLVPTIRPTAIIAETSEVAIAFLEAAHELGLKVPEGLSILSLTDSEALNRASPPVSVLHQPYGEMFAKACERLMATSSGNAVEPPSQGFEFVDRGSLARAPRAV